MDWSIYYPAYAVRNEKEQRKEDGAEGESHDQDHAPSPTAKAISQPVEIADIGCGYGGLLFALAPKFPNTLILGLPSSTPSSYNLLTLSKEWKSAPRSLNMYKKKYAPSALNTPPSLPTKMYLAYAPTR